MASSVTLVIGFIIGVKMILLQISETIMDHNRAQVLVK